MQEVKDWLEIVYLLSGPAIAVIAYLALGQIRVAKDQIKEQKNSLRVTSKRDALKLTADQVTMYFDKIIPLQNALDERLKDDSLKVLDNFIIEFDSGAIKLTPPKEDFNFKDFSYFSKEFIDVANAMESFSTYFAAGVADENVAYLSLGSTFCSSMKKMAPILIPLSNDERRFSATLRLYSIWGPRREREVLERQKLEIDKKLKSRKPISIKIVGDEI